ncbi:MAG: ATP-binding cassette domain-containing protein, partial [Janthinobacterium sp.]
MPTDIPPAPSAAIPLLTLDNIGKSYVGPVLGGVRLRFAPGQVLALTGENGAGKSTLSKIICGLEQATTGTMLLDGKPYQPASRGAAEALGIRMVMQELNLIPTLSIAENLYLKNLPQRFGFIDRTRLERDAREQMEKVGLGGLDPWTLVGELGIGHQQMIE